MGKLHVVDEFKKCLKTLGENSHKFEWWMKSFWKIMKPVIFVIKESYKLKVVFVRFSWFEWKGAVNAIFSSNFLLTNFVPCDWHEKYTHGIYRYIQTFYQFVDPCTV